MPKTVIYTGQEIKLKEDGQYYTTLRRVHSHVTQQAVYKSLRGFQSEHDAYQCLEHWRRRGWTGSPASPASFFRRQLLRMHKLGHVRFRCVASPNHLLKSHFRGGWIEAMKLGTCRGRHYHYDLRNAYLWSALQGLPRTLRPYQPGDRNFVAIMDHIEGDNLPNRFERMRRALVTSEDLQVYPMEGQIIGGVSFDDLDVNLSPVLYELADLPGNAFKSLSQSFWGCFASYRPISVRYYEGGQELRTRYMYNRLQNLTWATLIINRVAARVWQQAQRGAVLVFIDSVVTPHPVRTGDQPGDWRHVETFDKGLYVRAPGVFDALPLLRRHDLRSWYKHCGIQG